MTTDPTASATLGLGYRAIDLHVHSPASRCFSDRAATGKQIVEAALVAGLDSIAITDHNSAEFIDQIQAAAKGTKLRVFPGVEITAGGGRTGLHVLAIFDPSESSSKVRDLLSRVHITPAQQGKDIAIADDVCKVIQEIHKSDAIAILAHANSSKGVMHDVQGQNRTRVFREDGLLAVEVTPGDFSENSERDGTRAVDLLRGKDKNYAKRKLAVVQASDAHSLADIGIRRTFIKTGSLLDLEGLRQTFIDPDTRIWLPPLNGDVLPKPAQPRIVSIAVKGGFFDGLDLKLHPSMNSIIGGKGSGKSLLIEFMRFGLDAESTNEEIAKDHLSKMERRLDRYGQVTIGLIDETGTTRNVTRTFDPTAESPYTDDDEALTASEFPVLFLSQNEIIRIAENIDEQLRFIDRFFDFRSYQRPVKQLSDGLLQIDGSMADSLRARRERDELQTQIKIHDRRILELDGKLKNETFASYDKASKKQTALKRISDAGDEILQIVIESHDSIALTVNPSLTKDLGSDPALKRALSALEETRGVAQEELASVADKVREKQADITDEIRKFAPLLKGVETKYREMVSAAGGNYKDLSSKRAELAATRTRLQTRLDSVSARAGKLKAIADLRKEKLTELDNGYRAYTKARQEKCADIEKFSNGRLKVSVQEASDTSEFQKRLGKMKKGSYLKDDEILKIVGHVTPNSFVASLLNYDIVSTDKKARFIEKLAKDTQIPLERMKVLADHLLQSRSYEDLLALQHQVTPEDRPVIQFCVADGVYEPLTSVSTGQKCTALLVMALAKGSAPIIIDQPEDSLDIKSIWSDMCTKLRASKSARQFICTTHNSSLAVASDTDYFIVLEASATIGHVARAGVIDSEDVKLEVINYLEGGVTTYGIKYKKYDMGKRMAD